MGIFMIASLCFSFIDLGAMPNDVNMITIYVIGAREYCWFLTCLFQIPLKRLVEMQRVSCS